MRFGIDTDYFVVSYDYAKTKKIQHTDSWTDILFLETYVLGEEITLK